VFNVQGGGGGGTGTIPFGIDALLFNLSVTVKAGAPTSTSVFNLLHDFTNPNGTSKTAIFANDANQSELVLSPAPTNNPTDPVDGIFGINTAVLASIAINPANPTVAKGLTQQFTATGTYTDNSTAVLTSQVIWASSNTAVATIDASGLASTLNVGTTGITAALGGGDEHR
jgi:uncharacterized protein YjdB